MECKPRLRCLEGTHIPFLHPASVLSAWLGVKVVFSPIPVAVPRSWEFRSTQIVSIHFRLITRQHTIGSIRTGSRMKNIVYFDLETQKSAEEVGGWDKISQMGMSIGVLYSTARNEYRIYGEKQVEELVRDLQRADLVVGFNNLRFDYEVLHGYTPLDLRQLPTLDMLVELQNQLQHRLSLDSIATATFGVEKTAEGMQALEWYKQGRLMEIAEYCCYDVKLTRLVHEYGVQYRQLYYHNRFGKKLTVPVGW